MRWMQGVKTFLVLAALAVPALRAGAQAAGAGRITGTVSDSSSAQGLASATVSVVGTQIGAQTGPDGRFTIVGAPSGAQQLRVQRLGFALVTVPVTVPVGGVATVNITMRPQAVLLSQVVSVGYGTQSRRDVAGAISSVTTEALERAPVASVDQVLQGTSPGVQVTTASSEPGGAISVRIRGTSSLTGTTEPLYVIDGFPIENDVQGASTGTGGRALTNSSNPLVTLNPSDIESISILKDASATAIYGARGANGVVIITTKQGRGQRPQFSLDFYTGANKVAKTYDMLDAAGYMEFANIYAGNQTVPFTPFPAAVRDSILASGTNTDWQDEIFRTGSVRNLQLAVRGATSAASPTRYALSGGIFSQDGIVESSGLRRLSGRFSLNQSVGSRIEFGGTINASHVRSRAIPTGGSFNAGAGAISAAIQYVPILPVQNADGVYSYINRDLNRFGALDAPQTPNPVSLVKEVRDSLSDTRLLTNVFGQVELMEGLDARVSFGADYADRWRYTYYPRTTLRGEQANGEALRNSSSTASWLNENTLSYARQFGSAHDVNAVVGYTRQKTDLDGESMTNSNFVSDITGYFDIGSGAQEGGPSIGSRRSTQTLESWLGRLNYSLLDRYLLTLTYRTDGSSRFAANHKWGSFPSAAFAWRTSSEPWFRDRFGMVDELKFRVSWGEVGNPSIPPYGSLASLNDQGYSFGGTQAPGYYPATVANPDLTWETTAETNAGIDLGLWDRVSLTADVYRKETRDLLLRFLLPLETGVRDVLVNRGKVRNSGVELGLDASVLRGGARGVNWRANLNVARNRSEVLDLGGVEEIRGNAIAGGDYSSGGTRIQVGKPLGFFYGFVADGIVRTAEDSVRLAGVRNFSNSSFRPGDLIIRDIAGRDSAGIQLPDGRITEADQTMIGDPTPDFTFGITNTISFRGFELTGLLQGQRGGEILNVNRARIEASPRVNVTRERLENSWTPENPNAKYPKINENPNVVANFFTSTLLEDASYLRLRTLTLSYQLPPSLLQRSRVTGARLYVTGTNLFTITDYTGFDPDVSTQSVSVLNRGIDIGAYPLSKGLTVGVNFNY